ncbi:MAG: hypothetical protein CK552_01240 [Actinobacteria bacterium]|nr:MAG: hypothetical protein CK552_01240 [Actinomycetota bacterium]
MRPIRIALATLSVGLLLVGAAILPAAAALAAPVAATTPALKATGPNERAYVISADAAYQAVSQFRPASHLGLTAFLSQYGDRLTPEQLKRAQAQVVRADLTLAQLEAKTRVTRILARSGASTTRIKQAADAASRAFDGATASTAWAMAEMQPMLQAKLSLFEGLQAKLELDRSMRDFAAVGAVVKAVRP